MTQSMLHPATPAGAYDDLLARVLSGARAQRTWQDGDAPLPALFVSHGAPPTLDDPQWLAALFGWAQSMPKPRAIVVVSAHWENAPLAICGAAAGTLSDTTEVHQHTGRGLDHGAFIPLMAMYPAADVPVIQVSMPSLDPAALLSLGQRLRALREEGILIIGSGFMTHSFEVMRNPALAGHTQAFDSWATDALARWDIDTLTDYRAKAPGAGIAHPTADHYVPLLLTLGAATQPGTAATAIDGVRFGNSIRSIQVA